MTAPTPVRPPGMRRNAIANIVGRGGSVLLWVVVTPYVLRHLGPERFAIWSLFFVLNGYVAALDFGMAYGAARFVAVAVARGDGDGARRAFLRSLAMSAAIGLVWCVVLLLGRGLFVKMFHVPVALAAETRSSLTIFAMALAAFAMIQVPLGTLLGFQRMDLWNGYFLAGLAVNAAVLVVGLGRGLGLPVTAVAALAGHLVVGALAFRSVRNGLARLPRGAASEPVSWRDLFGFGGLVQLSNVLTVGQLQIGKVVLGTLGRLTWVTPFELGFRVTNAVWSLPTLVHVSVIPAVTHASTVGGEAAAREVYEWSCRWVYAMAAWMMGGFWLAAPAVYRLWIGSDQPEAAAVARWLAIAFAASTLAGPGTAVARGIGKPGLEVLNFGVALGVNALLVVWLVPRFGPVGAAMAMAVSFGVASVCLLAGLHRRIHFSGVDWLRRLMLPRYVAAALAAAASALATSAWSPHSRAGALVVVLGQGALFTLLYSAATWRTGDLRALWAHGRRWIARARAAAAPSPAD